MLERRMTMKRSRRLLWGLILIVFGVCVLLNRLDVTDFNIFFDGWWTLFIIVPCTVNLFTEKNKFGSLICIAIGVFLLLCAQNVIEYSLFWKFFGPAIIVIIGLKMVFSGLFSRKMHKESDDVNKKSKSAKKICAVFSGSDIKSDSEVFEGAELVAIFGGVDCDLRGAVIENDCSIDLFVAFGGIDILVPENVNVKLNSTCIFGGVSNKASVYENAPTIYINGVCLFGGVDIKEKAED